MGIQRSLTAKPKKTHFQDTLFEEKAIKRPNHTTKEFYRGNKGGFGEEAYMNTTLTRQGIQEDVDEKNYLEDIKVLTWESFSEDSAEVEKKEEYTKNRKYL